MEIPDDHRKYLDMDFELPAEFESVLERHDIYNIELYGCWLRALEQGIIQPFTEEQEPFLRVVTGTAEPHTDVQKSWLKYREACSSPLVCRQCAGKGYYTNPINGDRMTCTKCHGTGKIGLTPVKISVEGFY